MQFASFPGKIAAALAALALCGTPVAASAAAPSARTPVVNPMVALSIFGSQASAAALCGSAATAAAATAAAQAQPGCVLPAVDPVAPPPPPPPPPLASPPPVTALPAATGFGIAPILLGLAGIAILAALISGSDDRSSDDQPVSPS